jgi:hypothetical protein
METWKQCAESDKHEVSDYGRIRSSCRHREKRILNGSIKQGYIFVTIKGKKRPLHRLICLAFYGESDLHVNHKDGVKTNNRLENLEFVTNMENVQHALDNDLQRPALIGSVDKDGVVVYYKRINEAASASGVSRKMIQKVVYGERKSTNGYIFFHQKNGTPDYSILNEDRGTPAKSLIMFKNGHTKRFIGINQASRETGYASKQISNYCNGRVKCKTADWAFD